MKINFRPEENPHHAIVMRSCENEYCQCQQKKGGILKGSITLSRFNIK